MLKTYLTGNKRVYIVLLVGFSFIAIISFLAFSPYSKGFFSYINPFQASVVPMPVEQKRDDMKEEIYDYLEQLQEQNNSLSEKIIYLEEKLEELSSVDSLLSENREGEVNEAEVAGEDISIEKEANKDVAPPKRCDIATGDSPLKSFVVLNEIAWMGTTTSASNEWIELKNISQNSIDLKGWQVIDKENQIEIFFEVGQVLPGKFFLLERTGEDTIPGTIANEIYTGVLSDTSEGLYLFNQDCILQDYVGANPDWPAGDKTSKRTMERKGDFNWQTSQPVGGTPNQENSSGYINIVYGSGGGNNGAPPPPPPIVYPKILISEIQIDPADDRFIEIYNPNTTEVILTDWYIQRKTETGDSFNSFVTKTDFANKTIEPNGYFWIAEKSEADIVTDLTLTENNSLVLKNPNGEIVDKLGFGAAQDFETTPTINPATGKSIGRKLLEGDLPYTDTNNNQNDFEIQVPTPNSSNTTFLEEEENEEDSEEQGASYLDVVINEVAWMGTIDSSNNEWLEIYNNTDSEIDLSGWVLKSTNDTPSISLSGIVLANNHFLLERTSDETLPEITADQIYVGALGNAGEYLQLYDGQNNLIDEIDSSTGWFAGDNDSKQTMERINPLVQGSDTANWATSAELLGTPRAQNSKYSP